MDSNKNTFWQTEKGKAAIKLGLWGIFIIILIIFVLFSRKDETDINTENTNQTPIEDNNSDFLSYEDMQSHLLNNNYEYVFTINTLNGKYVYSGVKSGDKEIGFKEDQNEIIKYYIDSTGTYRVYIDRVETIDNLYQNIDNSYLDMEVLFENLNNYLYTEDIESNVRTITYDKEGYQVVVNTDKENITNIIIFADSVTYELDFTKIGECATIEFTI